MTIRRCLEKKRGIALRRRKLACQMLCPLVYRCRRTPFLESSIIAGHACHWSCCHDCDRGHPPPYHAQVDEQKEASPFFLKPMERFSPQK
jgi:hypothetical protein